MEKNVFFTKTGASALAGLLVVLFGLFGVDVEESEMTKGLLALGSFLSFVGVLVGRIMAKDKATLGKAKKEGTKLGALLFAIILLPSMMTACALKNMQPYEKASSVAYEMLDVYKKNHKHYAEVLEEASPALKSKLRKEVSPFYNQTKSVVIELTDLSQAWRITEEKPGDWDALLAKAQVMVPRLATKLNNVLKEYRE